MIPERNGLILELGWLIWYASLDGPNDWGDEIYVIDKIQSLSSWVMCLGVAAEGIGGILSGYEFSVLVTGVRWVPRQYGK